MWKQYHLAIKGVRKGYLPANFFFFFFWCKQLDPGTEPPLQNLFECLPPDQYKPIMSLKTFVMSCEWRYCWLYYLFMPFAVCAIWKLSYSIGLWSSTEEGGGYSFSGLAFWKPVFCNWLENVYDIRRQSMSFYFTPVWSYIREPVLL